MGRSCPFQGERTEGSDSASFIHPFVGLFFFNSALVQFCTVLSCFLSAWAPLFVAYYKCLSVEVWFCLCVMICCRLCLSASGSLWKLHYVRFPPVSRCSYLELHYLFCSSVFLCLFFFLFGYKCYRTVVSVDGDLLAWLLFRGHPSWRTRKGDGTPSCVTLETPGHCKLSMRCRSPPLLSPFPNISVVLRSLS